MNNFITRTITGIIFVAVLIGSIFLGPEAFAILFFIFTFLGLVEFTKLQKDIFQGKTDKIVFYLASLFLYITITLYNIQYLSPFKLVIILLIPIFITLYTLFSFNKKPLQFISSLVFGGIYIAIPLALLSSFFFVPFNDLINKEIIIGFLIILWVNDVFAYLVGSLIGRTKLFEKVSPKKTWEGTIGGGIFAVGASYLLSTYFNSLEIQNWLAIGLIITIFATLGDLLESLFKRNVNIKDSGSILPGHGGVLDRFDGVLLSSPAVYIYLTIFA